MVREKLQKVKDFAVTNARTAAASFTVTTCTLVPALTSYATETSTDAGFLDAQTVTVITDSVAKMAVTITAVVGICIPVAFTIMGLTVAAKYALRYVKNMLNRAAAA